MRKATHSLGEAMVEEGLISSTQLQQLETEIQKTHEPFQKVLKRLRLIDDNKWILFLSSHFNIPRVEVSHQIVKPTILKMIPEDLVRKFGVFPLLKVGKRLSVAMSDPLNLTVIDQLRVRTGFEIDVALATDAEIRSAIEQNYGLKSEMSDVVESIQSESGKKEAKFQKVDAEQYGVEVDEAPIVKLVNAMIASAIRDRASDIHIEPGEKDVLVRYRVDGTLREIDHYPSRLHPGVVSRIKILADLDISENRMPQDGRARFENEGQEVDLRISVVPTVYGENLVLRLLNTRSALLPLEALGMGSDRLALFREIIKKPYGIFLITGPTGSGKTTTLYSALNQINSIERNIITVEDPVEYHLPLIRQIQVNPKVNLTFATGLRSILRQDPNVIMIGEIRDRETAEIAVQAALTGHMVFSTLHTNNAASTVTRLLDMGIEPFLIASSICGIMSQRLVRKICLDCKESFKAEQADLDRLKISVKSDFKFYRGKGCTTCRKTGYQGRTALFEVFIPDEFIKQLILKRGSNTEIEMRAVQNGMRTLLDDGIQKVEQGVTTLEEVLRVTQD